MSYAAKLFGSSPYGPAGYVPAGGMYGNSSNPRSPHAYGQRPQETPLTPSTAANQRTYVEAIAAARRAYRQTSLTPQKRTHGSKRQASEPYDAHRSYASHSGGRNIVGPNVSRSNAAGPLATVDEHSSQGGQPSTSTPGKKTHRPLSATVSASVVSATHAERQAGADQVRGRNDVRVSARKSQPRYTVTPSKALRSTASATETPRVSSRYREMILEGGPHSHRGHGHSRHVLQQWVGGSPEHAGSGGGGHRPLGETPSATSARSEPVVRREHISPFTANNDVQIVTEPVTQQSVTSPLPKGATSPVLAPQTPQTPRPASPEKRAKEPSSIQKLTATMAALTVGMERRRYQDDPFLAHHRQQQEQLIQQQQQQQQQQSSLVNAAGATVLAPGVSRTPGRRAVPVSPVDPTASTPSAARGANSHFNSPVHKNTKSPHGKGSTSQSSPAHIPIDIPSTPGPERMQALERELRRAIGEITRLQQEADARASRYHDRFRDAQVSVLDLVMNVNQQKQQVQPLQDEVRQLRMQLHQRDLRLAEKDDMIARLQEILVKRQASRPPTPVGQNTTVQLASFADVRAAQESLSTSKDAKIRELSAQLAHAQHQLQQAGLPPVSLSPRHHHQHHHHHQQPGLHNGRPSRSPVAYSPDVHGNLVPLNASSIANGSHHSEGVRGSHHSSPRSQRTSSVSPYGTGPKSPLTSNSQSHAASNQAYKQMLDRFLESV